MYGLSNKSTQKRLLTEDDKLTLKQVLEIAMTVEKASIHVKQMKSDHRHAGGILHTTPPISSCVTLSNPTCHRCGGPHLAPNCRFVNEKCLLCGKTGHIAKVCRSKPPSTSTYTPKSQGSKNSKPLNLKTNTVEVVGCQQTVSQSSSEYTMFNLSVRSPPIMVPVHLNDFSLQMELDTGAAIVKALLNPVVYTKLLLSHQPILSYVRIWEKNFRSYAQLTSM